MPSPLYLPILSPAQNSGIGSFIQGMQAGYMPQTTAADIAAKQALAQYNVQRGGYYGQYGDYRQAQADNMPNLWNAQAKQAISKSGMYDTLGQKNIAQANQINQLTPSKSADLQAKAANTFQQAINNGFDANTAMQMAQMQLTAAQNAPKMQNQQQVPAMQQQLQMQGQGQPAQQETTGTQGAVDLQGRLDNLNKQIAANQQQQQQFQQSSPAQILNSTPQSTQQIPLSGPKLKTDVSFTRALENGPNFVSTLDNAYSTMMEPSYKDYIGAAGKFARSKNKLSSYAGVTSPGYSDFAGKSKDITLNAESMAKAFTNTNAFSGIKLNVDMLNPASDQYPNAQSQAAAVQDFALSYADRLAQQLKLNYPPADREAILKNLQILQQSKVYQDAINNADNIKSYGGYSAKDIKQVMKAYNMTIPQAYAFVDEHAKGAK